MLKNQKVTREGTAAETEGEDETEDETVLLTSLCITSSLVNSMASSLNGSATCIPEGVFLELRGHSIPGQTRQKRFLNQRGT